LACRRSLCDLLLCCNLPIFAHMTTIFLRMDFGSTQSSNEEGYMSVFQVNRSIFELKDYHQMN
jgi:hypothetical protein